VTDQPTPGGAQLPEPGSPDAPPVYASADAPAQAPYPPTVDEPPAPWTAPEAPKPSRRRTFLIIGAIVVFLAIVLFVVRNNASADDLKVGECFDIPGQTTIETVTKHPCNESHGAEVIFVGEYSGDTYPISSSLDSYIEESCVPAFESYVGQNIDSQAALSIGYFYPSRDSWDSGDRTITCYALHTDESPMTESVKGT
jgi:Septum formation